MQHGATEETLKTLLANHDWYHGWSDDGAVWRRGVAQREAILATMKELKSYGADPHHINKLYNDARPDKKLFTEITEEQ